jgi:integrase
MTVVALGTALRRGELLALRWRDLQLLEGLLTGAIPQARER